jgi:hypothetical protein
MAKEGRVKDAYACYFSKTLSANLKSIDKFNNLKEHYESFHIFVADSLFLSLQWVRKVYAAAAEK